MAILGQVALGYSPFIERTRTVTATRLCVFPLRPDAALDVAQLLEAVALVWPAESGKVLLNIVSESLLHDLLQASPAANVMIEVPNFMALDPTNTDALLRLHAAGVCLLLKGRPKSELPAHALACFKYSVIDLDDDRRIGDAIDAPSGVSRCVLPVLSGVHSVADMESAFARDAHAVLGWPIEETAEAAASTAAKPKPRANLQAIVDLMRGVDRQDPIEDLEAILKRDPSIAFQLLRHMNSPAFGLRVEVSSFRHAIMMLGYQRLKRWLALLLATASKDVNLRPLMFAAIRRGLLMEELVADAGDDEMKNEAFICGVFSLLDRMFGETFEKLLDKIPVPERVFQALVNDTGPFEPCLAMIQAVEAESLFDYREAAGRLLMSFGAINRCAMRALRAANDLG